MATAPAFSWSHLGLIVLGGAVGVGARELLLVIPAAGWQAVAVPVINVGGAFLLGVLTGALAGRAEDARTRGIRHLLGTGVLGGFTTYSTFAVQAVSGTPVWLTLGTAVVGVAAAAAGMLLAHAPARILADRAERARREGDDA